MAEQTIRVESSLGPAVLRLRSLRGREELGRPYEFTLELHTLKSKLQIDDLLGQPLAVHLPLREGGERHFHGHVVELAETGASGKHTIYQAKLRPWFALLGYNSNCRVFQGKSA
ncbi:MAG TPA: contractile injection system protein, VgrG/Pvc8 family, partial [Polyangiales bacterium]|nr:contractile injection system protein, VgrG/Pvc8 family [Polyangiales bacterium]